MMLKRCLTSEFVNEISPPARGEIWIGDSHLDRFGIRAWAGKKGGGKAYSIRLRDQFGNLVRESYRPDRDFPHYYWLEESEKQLGYFLEHARSWARKRIRFHLGLEKSVENKWYNQKRRALSLTLDAAFERKLKKLRRKSNDHLYIDHIQNLIGSNIPKSILLSNFGNVPVRKLADAISHKSITYGNVKVLRAFVGGVFKDTAKSYGPLYYKLESIQRRCARNLDERVLPPYPKILTISHQNYNEFLMMLESDENWRQSLAIRFYFSTEALFQPILRARWSDFIGKIWYPYIPEERKLWFESKQRLSDDSKRIVEIIEERHKNENLDSPYLFPSLKNSLQPIKTVQRHWRRYCGALGWEGLPLSHVVLGYKERANPSYSLFFYRYYLQHGRAECAEAVSKVAKRRQDKSINAATYMVGPLTRENLIA